MNFIKSFESEKNELTEWLFQKTEEYMEAVRKDKTRGRDSKLNYDRAQDVREYNRRLTELRKKYGKDNILPQEATPRKETERVYNK